MPTTDLRRTDRARGPISRHGTRTIRQSVTLKASPKSVYEALIDSETLYRFTGVRAWVSPRVGGRFVAYGGHISGKIIELQPHKRIVQAWRGSNWPDGHYSRAVFSIHKVAGGAKISFRQTGVPEEHYLNVKDGWVEFYWKRLKRYFAHP